MEPFRAYRVETSGDEARGRVRRLAPDTLPDHDVGVRVAWSSLNYKDALSARGNRGVTKSYPHTPGIDAAGTVTDSRDERFAPGDRVIVTSYDLGTDTPGGFGERIRVPGDWIVPLPAGLEPRSAMALGTAGLTAGLALDALERWGAEPDAGPALVTGASGGVGSLAVALLAGAGWEVHAATGSPEHADLLRELGATEIVPRADLSERSERPLGSARWAAAIDPVGGPTLENVIKGLRPGGAVAACGLVQSPRLELSVYPFILRGAALLGVDSAGAPMARRRAVWERLAGPWRIDTAPLVTEIGLDELDARIDAILAGETRGRVLVRVAGDPG